MSVLDYILEGLEAELALQRELGVHFVECDRDVLRIDRSAQEIPSPPEPTPAPTPAPVPAQTPILPSAPTSSPAPTLDSATIVFLHHAPLSAAGEDMMAKIVAALGLTREEVPIVSDVPIPKAKVYVVLGGLALKKFQPRLKGVPGQWLKSEKGADILVTYSPEYILRFKEVTNAVKQIKVEMWKSLKSVLQRI